MNSQRMLRETDDRFDYWFADDRGITMGFSPVAYKEMDLETAEEVRDELDEIIEFYSTRK